MKEKRKLALLCGLLGCLCYGGGDWLMMYGDPAHTGKLIWLTNGTAQIPMWRYLDRCNILNLEKKTKN